MGPGELAALVSRWLHIVGAIAAVGGAIFALFVLLPASGVLSADAREKFHAAVRQRWSKIVFTAIGILLLSGLYNFVMISKGFRGELPGWYHPLFGIKFLLALAVFAIASLLAGRTTLAQRMGADEVLAVAESAAGRADHRYLGRDADGTPAGSAGRGGSRSGGGPAARGPRPGRPTYVKPAAGRVSDRPKVTSRGQEGEEEDRSAARPDRQIAAAIGRRQEANGRPGGGRPFGA